MWCSRGVCRPSGRGVQGGGHTGGRRGESGRLQPAHGDRGHRGAGRHPLRAAPRGVPRRPGRRRKRSGLCSHQRPVLYEGRLSFPFPGGVGSGVQYLPKEFALVKLLGRRRRYRVFATTLSRIHTSLHNHLLKAPALSQSAQSMTLSQHKPGVNTSREPDVVWDYRVGGTSEPSQARHRRMTSWWPAAGLTCRASISSSPISSPSRHAAHRRLLERVVSPTSSQVYS